MYEEKKKRFNWIGFILKLILLGLIVFLLIKLLPINNNSIDNNGYSKIFNTNFTKFKEVGNNYFTKDKLPKDGEESKISLKQLVKDKKINSLKDQNGKSCNEDNSYIKSYKKNIGYELEVYLECADEKDTSYIYLGCFDDCVVTTKKNGESNSTTTTSSKETTSEKTTKESSTSKKTTTKNTTKKVTTTKRKTTTKNSSNYTYKTTKKTTTTTTRIQKYAVIFNVNGGSKVETQNVVKGSYAVKPANPTKKGYVFKGWYLNGSLYNFNTPVTSNIILIAKWEFEDDSLAYVDNNQIKYTFSDTLYSAAIIDINSKTVSSKTKISVPETLKNYSDVKVKNVLFVRNFNSQSDLDKLYLNGYNINNFGLVNNVEISVKDNILSWNALVNKNAKVPVKNTSGYGIVVKIVWEYSV